MRTRSLLAGLLSLLIVSTPLSGWACDLSCSLLHSDSDCHTPSSAMTSKDDATMSMSPDMDMGLDHTESTMGQNPRMNDSPGHSMSMSPQMGMATERDEYPTRPEMGTSALHDHSKTVSSCTHDTCSQIAASASPPRSDHSQPSSLQQAAIGISNSINLRIGFHWMRVGTDPPKLLTTPLHVTSLRI